MTISEWLKLLRQVLGMLTGCSPVGNVTKSICLGPGVMEVLKLPLEMVNQ